MKNQILITKGIKYKNNILKQRYLKKFKLPIDLKNIEKKTLF